MKTEEVIDSLPREEKGPLNARVWYDASGLIHILPEGGGEIYLHEQDIEG